MVSIVNINDLENNIFLSQSRKDKISRIKNEKSIKLSMAAEEAYNRASVKRCGEIVPYAYNERGKPINNRFCFSISHSGEYAVCAVSDSCIGVDIQKIRRFDMSLCERFFLPDEFEFVKNGDNRDDTFFEVWVKKEAYVKATGEGVGAFGTFSVFRLKNCKFKMHDAPQGYKICTCTLNVQA